MNKWLIASDIHGSAYYCQKLMEAIQREKPFRVLLLGDILYHGPRNPLPREYDPPRVVSMLSSLSPHPLCVRGNCESEVDQMVLPFPVLADYALVPMGERLLFLTHGHKFSLENPPAIGKGDILLTGHTHIPAWRQLEGMWQLNPGSISLPKENSPHSYMILEDGLFTWKDEEGREYHRLDMGQNEP